MDNNKLKIFFLGSGDIAVPVLKILCESKDIELLGIATQPDRPAGRKKKLLPTPVGRFADDKGLFVYKISNVNSYEFTSLIKSLNIDFLIVVSFGQILKEKLLTLPKYCCLNIHASLLPKYRGASPISAAILNGENSTGISFMKMDKGLDTGPVFSMNELIIGAADTSEILEHKLGRLAAENIIECLHKICTMGLKPVEQVDAIFSYAGIIKKEDGRINWTKSATNIERMIRAYAKWPGTYFYLKIGENLLKIEVNQAKVISSDVNSFGKILNADTKSFIIGCGDKTALSLIKITPAGKKTMNVSDFMRGIRTENLSLE